MNWQSVFSGIGGAVLNTILPGLAGVVAGRGGERVMEAVGGMIAEKLGVDPTPEAVKNATPEMIERAATELSADPEAVKALHALMLAEAHRATRNDAAEAEKGFGAWQARRTVTTYLLLVMLAASFFATLASALGLIRADVAQLTVLVGHSVTLFMAWNGLVSGGRAVTDAVKAWKGGA